MPRAKLPLAESGPRKWGQTYYEKNRERILAQQKAYYQRNKPAFLARAKKWKAKPENRAKLVGYYRKMTYGMTPAQYDAMYEEQKGRCKTCGAKTTLNVDHDHATGRIRGLLCPKCNKAIGLLNDDPTLVMAVVQYLMQFQPQQ